MQYRTTIEVVTEADNEHEAADIAGEFLKGSISPEADIKVKTVSTAKMKGIMAVATIAAVSAVLSVPVIGERLSYKIARVERKPVTSYAIQPPLKTNLSSIQDTEEFKAVWEKAQNNRLNSTDR